MDDCRSEDEIEEENIMSRSGYDGECDGWQLIMYRGSVASSIRGKRGQQLLRDMLAAMDAMPEKVLIAHALEADGKYCALGVVGKARGIDMTALDPEEPDQIAPAFDIAAALAREVAYINDEWGHKTQEGRWSRVRAWVVDNLLTVY